MHQIETSKAEKLELLSDISDQPLREAQRIVLSQSSAPELMRPDQVKVISEEKVEYRFTAPASLEKKIIEVKGLLAHKYPQLSMAELFEVLCEMGIEALKNQKTATSRKQGVNKSKQGCANNKNQTSLSRSNVDETELKHRLIEKPKSLAQMKREVWQESLHQCQNCGSQYSLEMDHQFPKAKGGSNTKDNLRILCRSCNQRAAIREFGQEKMDFHLN